MTWCLGGETVLGRIKMCVFLGVRVNFAVSKGCARPISLSLSLTFAYGSDVSSSHSSITMPTYLLPTVMVKDTLCETEASPQLNAFFHRFSWF